MVKVLLSPFQGGEVATEKKNAKRKTPRLQQACEALQKLAPVELAQSWDNVGLLAGDPAAPVNKVMLCIDLTPEVAEEAVRGQVDLVVAYHPPIFKPVHRMTAQSSGPEASVFRCIANGIAVYSTHTALDAADGGTNDVLASLCGIRRTKPLQYVHDAGEKQCKFVTFVPAEHLEAVAEAMFAAGAGIIGDYGKCSYRLEGYGTFLGSEATSPAVGRAGMYERVEEVRLETACPIKKVPQVTAALFAVHPYEEPAFDIYPLKSAPVRGAGRYGCLPRPISLRQLARKLKRTIGANCVQIVGQPQQQVSRAIVAVGAAGALPFSIPLSNEDVIVTGEIRHHDALTILRRGCCAIALNHWTSERPVLHAFGERLAEMVPGVSVSMSDADGEPFLPV